MNWPQIIVLGLLGLETIAAAWYAGKGEAVRFTLASALSPLLFGALLWWGGFWQ